MTEHIELAVAGLSDACVIGVGGFGTVLQAKQEQFDRWVAVKVLSGPLIDHLAQSRFKRECRALGTLSGHPFIVTLYDAGLDDNGRPYLVMPLLARGSLQQRILKQGPLPPVEAAFVSLKLAGALQTAHDAGILHRDVKPDNVLFNDYDQPQLADFGIARLADASQTSSGVTTGTFQYSAPELFDGASPSAATDVYALAATTYAMLTGGPPFTIGPDESLVALIKKVTTQPAAPLPGTVPADIAEAVMAGLAKDPNQRLATAADFARSLLHAEGETLPTDAFVVLNDLASATAQVREGGGIDRIATEAVDRDVPTRPQEDTAARRRSSRSGFAVGAAVAVALLAAAAWYTRDTAPVQDGPAAGATPPAETGAAQNPPSSTDAETATTVPDVEGRRLALARKRLEALGFDVIIQRREDAGTDHPTVVTQRPRAGSPAPEGAAVRLIVAVPAPPAGIDAYLTTDGSTPTASQSCWGLIGVCLGAPLEQVTQLLGTEDERYGTPGEVSRQWRLRDEAVVLTVTSDDVESITGMTIALEDPQDANIALPEELVLGQMDMGDAVDRLGEPYEEEQDYAENWTFYRYSYRVGPEGSVMLTFSYNAEIDSPGDPGGFNAALDNNPVLAFTVDYPFAHAP